MQKVVKPGAFHASSRDPEKFAIYAGGGSYLSGVAVRNIGGESVNVASFDKLEKSVSLARREAVAACHAVRRAGVSAWLVRHPVGALS